jgi:hypothetical protein
MRLDQVNIKEKFYLNYLEIYRGLQAVDKLNGVAHQVKIVAIKAFKLRFLKRSFRNQRPVWQGGDSGRQGSRSHLQSVLQEYCSFPAQSLE